MPSVRRAKALLYASAAAGFAPCVFLIAIYRLPPIYSGFAQEWLATYATGEPPTRAVTIVVLFVAALVVPWWFSRRSVARVMTAECDVAMVPDSGGYRVAPSVRTSFAHPLFVVRRAVAIDLRAIALTQALLYAGLAMLVLGIEFASSIDICCEGCFLYLPRGFVGLVALACFACAVLVARSTSTLRAVGKRLPGTGAPLLERSRRPPA